MKTKISLFTLVLVLSTTLTFAQYGEETRTSFGILAGVGLQNLNGKDMSGDKLDNKMVFAYHVGVNVQFPIAPQFYFQPGLTFGTKGGKNETGNTTSTYNIYYLELPLNLLYKARLGSGYIHLGFGPYLGYGIGGKASVKNGSVTVDSDIEFKKELEIGDSLTTAYFRPFDAGANIFFGYETSAGLFAQLNAQLGMLNVNPDDNRLPDNDYAIKNTGFGLSIGYRF